MANYVDVSFDRLRGEEVVGLKSNVSEIWREGFSSLGYDTFQILDDETKGRVLRRS
jgi:hypothetical protein